MKPFLTDHVMTCSLLFMLAASPLIAQPQTHLTLGATTVDAPAFRFAGNIIYLTGGVDITAPNYHLKAQEIDVTVIPGKAGDAAIGGVTADGDLAHHVPVTGNFRQTALGRDYAMQADHAVYTPNPARPGYGQIHFTGHPVITLSDPSALAAPAVTTAAQIIVLVGPGNDYPQIEGSEGHITFTPLH